MAQSGDERGHLVARNLATLARLAALRDLDLQLFGHRQVARGDAEAAGGDLLHLVVGNVRPRLVVPAWVLAALAASWSVRRCRFIAIERVRCASGLSEPSDIAVTTKRLTMLSDRLDLLERNRRAERLQLAAGRGRP